MSIVKYVSDRYRGKAGKGQRRSSQWKRVRLKHLEDNPSCAVCEGIKLVEVHHIKAFHTHPELELEPSNLMTLCEAKKYGISCHQLMGHLGNYSRINSAVEIDAYVWNRKIKGK